MDYARKIGKIHEPKMWLSKPPSVALVRDGLICPDTVFKEDSRLKNWKKWLSIRKDEHKKIKSKTGRHQTDQIMNSCETVRPLIEMRNLMDYATIPAPVIPDKYRGGPEFWKTPPMIPKWDPCLPDIRFAPNKKDLNVDPELTYIDLPKLIQEEKDLVGLKSKTPLWKRSKYLKKRKQQLSEEIELLVPKEPRSRKLIVKNHVFPKKVKGLRVPPIMISNAEDEPHCAYPEQTVVLKIQDIEIRQILPEENDQINCEPIRWSLNFSSKVNRMEEKEIVFENKGNRVIIYQWRDVRFRSKALPLKRRISPFFFNKTKGVILPGQFFSLKIWYRSRIAGIFVEFWRLVTDPELCPSPLIFRFWGHAETMRKVEEERAQTVDKYLDRCIRNSVIREIIEEIIENIGFVKAPEPAYGTLFLESEIFIAKNQMCFYNPSLLIEFQKIYQTATNQKQHRWNLSINDLRDILLKIKHTERRHFLLKRLNQLYKECLKPVLYKPVYCNKYETVFDLLCHFFNRFEIESERIRQISLGKERDSKMNCTMENSSETFVKDINGRISNSLESDSIEESRNDSIHTIHNVAYGETFYICIYQLLAETMERIFATIDSFNNLNESDK